MSFTLFKYIALGDMLWFGGGVACGYIFKDKLLALWTKAASVFKK